MKSLPGTRDAAQNWEREYMDFMEQLGFESGKITPCVFWHPQDNLRLVVHGDDFTVLAKRSHLDWFRDEIKKTFEVKFLRFILKT